MRFFSFSPTALPDAVAAWPLTLKSSRTQRRLLLVLLGLSSLVGTIGLQAALRVENLRCEEWVDPQGIDVATPNLYWRVASDEHAQMQSAWQVLVASSADALAQDHGDLWDSGRMMGDQTTQIPYAGKKLISSAEVFWKVRSWDGAGVASAWSATARWTMGLLGPTDWKGTWIEAAGASESLLLRHEFTVRPGLRRALVHVTGLGQYELSFNGAKAGEDLLTPGWTNFERSVLYDTQEVTAMLHEGRNAAGLFLGNGMYDVTRRDRFVKFAGYAGPLRAILHLRLEYADGTTEYVGTDPAWRTHPGPIVAGNIYSGEDYDARLAPVGWDRVGFDERAWSRAVPIVREASVLHGLSVSADPIRAIETRQPVNVRPLPDGSVLYDLGQNASCMPRITVSGPAGSTVRLVPGEVINPDGTIDRGSMGGTSRGWSWWQYTKATDAPETWMPKFSYIGCRYLRAEFSPPDDGDLPAEPGVIAGVAQARLPHLDAVEGVIVHSIAEPLGDFSTSNDLLNRIRTLVRWAQRSNMMSVLTDCPHREKLGWLEQYHLNGPSIRYEFDVARIYRKGEQDMADAQTKEGLIPTTAPEYAKFEGDFRMAAEWGASFLLVPWQQYQFTGDTELLYKHYAAMKRYFAWLESRTKNGLLSDGLGDWYDLDLSKKGRANLTPSPITATAFYFDDATVLSQIATVIGKPDEARDYAARAAKIRARYNQEFFKADVKSYGTGSEASLAIPLVMGIADPSMQEPLVSALVRDVGQRGYATAGDIGFRYLLQALAQGGRSDAIYRLINQDEKPGYGYQLKQGATALTEAWDASHGSSQDHFMLGQVTEWFYKDLAGIDVDPEGPGFKKILLRPQPVPGLGWVNASYESIHGLIKIRWEQKGGTFLLSATVPANTTATIFVPATEGSKVTENGAAVESSAGVKFIRREGDRAVYALGSGSYSFSSQWTPKSRAEN